MFSVTRLLVTTPRVTSYPLCRRSVSTKVSLSHIRCLYHLPIPLVTIRAYTLHLQGSVLQLTIPQLKDAHMAFLGTCVCTAKSTRQRPPFAPLMCHIHQLPSPPTIRRGKWLVLKTTRPIFLSPIHPCLNRTPRQVLLMILHTNSLAKKDIASDWAKCCTCARLLFLCFASILERGAPDILV